MYLLHNFQQAAHKFSLKQQQQNMLMFSSRQKDRNYHRSKNKLFNHAHIRSSKDKLLSNEETKDVTINLHLRAKSPSKQSKAGRSPSKGSKKSKNSVFSDKDRVMTRQIGAVGDQINMNKDMKIDRRREFRSPQEVYQSNKRKQRLSEQSKGLKLVRSRQLQKQEHTRRKQRYPKLFQPHVQTPKRTPPRSPRHQFMPQQGQITIVSNRQTQQLDDLREQNQFYKLIYRASLQKMKRLQRSIQKQKQEYQKTREQFNKELRQLKHKINRNDKKVSIGHIYSYDQKDTLKIQPQNIIPETDNQASEITRNNEGEQRDIKGRRERLPSRLSIDSM